MNEIDYHAASAKEMKEVMVLLEEAHLPVEGVTDLGANLVVATCEGRVVGAAGIEGYGTEALLRSVVVAADWRTHGIGGELVRCALEVAEQRGAGRVYLLTEGASEYFRSRGFQVISRDDIGGEVARSAEFSRLCPSTAVAMVLSIKSKAERGK